MVGFVVFISQHNMWLYYGWVCLRCYLSVNTLCGRIMVRFVFVVVSQYAQYVVVL
jgi:hypothetical protein